MSKIYISTYGCTLNRADSDIIIGILKAAKHEIVSSEKEAEVVLLNTCIVKGTTENKILDRIARLVKEKKKLVVVGCIAAESDRVWRVAPNVPIVWPSAISQITDAVEDTLVNKKNEYKVREKKDELPRVFTAPILRIGVSEGCIGHCNFCQTKLARPVLQSIRPRTIRDVIKHGLQNRAREIQLTSMDMGAYGIDIKTNLLELMSTINSMDGKFFVRLGMINPEHVLRMKDKIVKQMKEGKFYHFLHVPVQAGSEKVVKEMQRSHTVADFEEVVEFFRKEIPDITIATDIIAGYPTETKQDFEKTIELVKRIKPDVVNLSRFSARPGTKAKEMKQLTTEEVKDRSRRLTEIIRGVCADNNRKLIGKEFEVLITEKQKNYTGRTRNYRQVVVDSKEVKLGDNIKVKIVDSNQGYLIGKILLL